jgi:predicted dithiol-disulfide oxidoreductase (DUF899 family)
MTIAKPPIVSPQDWARERDSLLVAEKELTHALDELAARRRRLPMVELAGDYIFDSPAGQKTLLELFDGRAQLVVYQFMDVGPDHYCPGCTWFTNNVPPVSLRLLADRGVSWATVSDMPLAQLEPYTARMGWTVPIASSRGTSFAADCGADGGFMLTALLRDGATIYRTYNTTQRGVDRLAFTHNVLDLTVYGRQEDWEDSPPGWPKGRTDW